MDCRASLAETTGCHGERRDESGVMASAARPSILEVRGDGLPRFARSDRNASWRAQRGHPSWRWAVMDCHASLAETKGCHGERSAAIHLRGARPWTATLRSQRQKCVMASAAWPSILEVRGHGLPRFARRDRNASWRAQRGHPSWRYAVMDCRAALAETNLLWLAVWSLVCVRHRRLAMMTG